MESDVSNGSFGNFWQRFPFSFTVILYLTWNFSTFHLKDVIPGEYICRLLGALTWYNVDGSDVELRKSWTSP